MALGNRSQRHDTDASRKVAGFAQHSDWWSFTAGQRVLTQEGLPGEVTDVEDGPVAGNETYIVSLDNNLGGGEYSAGELQPLDSNRLEAKQAAVPVQRSDGTTIFIDSMDELDDAQASLHTAAEDYPELSEILVRRPPIGDVKVAHKKILKDAAADPEFADAEIEVEAGVMDRMFNPAAERVLRSLPQEFRGDDNGAYSYDWCRFRRNSQCWYPKELDARATEAAGYQVWVPELRGTCPRTEWDEQQACPLAEPGPKSGERDALVDATIPWNAGGQRGGIPDVYSTKVELTTKEAHLEKEAEFRFHFTAGWRDIQSKAKRIRTEGGVRIIGAPGKGPGSDSLYIQAEVKGDTALYQTTLMRTPGGRTVATWECGCAWAAYSWGRSGRWKKYEGRMCSHALATVYEAQAQEMFGGTIKEKAEKPLWRKDPTMQVQIQHEKKSTLHTALPTINQAQADPENAIEEVAEYLHDNAESQQSAVTRAMQQNAKAYQGEMQGLQYAVKGLDSMKRKLKDKADKYSIETIVTRPMDVLTDALRYTIAFPEPDWGDSVQKTLWSLQQDGFRIKEEENYWQRGDAYSGLHYILEAPRSRLPVELQFHTSRSVRLKEDKLHALYEEFRARGTEKRRQQELYDIMASYWEDVPLPENALDFPELKFKGRPAKRINTNPELLEAPIVSMGRSMLYEGSTATEVLAYLYEMGTPDAISTMGKVLTADTAPFKVKDADTGFTKDVVIDTGSVMDYETGERVDEEKALYPTYDPQLGLDIKDSIGPATAVADDQDGVMIAFRPPDWVLDALVLDDEDAESYDNLHITLLYLGKAADVDADKLTETVRIWAGAESHFTGTVSGYGTFQNGEENVFYAGWDIPELHAARARLEALCEDVGITSPSEHGFTPHTTLRYGNLPDSMPELPEEAKGDVHFEQVAVVIGPTWTWFDFTPAGQPAVIDTEGFQPEAAYITRDEAIQAYHDSLEDNDAGTPEPHVLMPDGEQYPYDKPEYDKSQWNRHAELHDEQEPALPMATAEEPDDDLDGSEAPDDVLDPSKRAWLGSAAASPQQQANDNHEIALAAKNALAKLSGKTFSPAEQKMIIEEGADGVVASNLADLDLAGTHYEELEAAFAAADSLVDESEGGLW